MMSRSYNDAKSVQIRERIAREAARLIARGKAATYHAARVRATRWLSQQKLTSAEIPTQAEILQQLQLLTLTTSWEPQQRLQYEAALTAELLGVVPLFFCHQQDQACDRDGVRLDWLTETVHIADVKQRLLSAQVEYQAITIEAGIEQLNFHSLLPQRIFFLHPQLWVNTEVIRHRTGSSVELFLENQSLYFDLWNQSEHSDTDLAEEPVGLEEISWSDRLLPLIQPLASWEWNHPMHPEGNGLYHALQVFELGRENFPWDEEFLWACLLHDIGYIIDPRQPTEAAVRALKPIVTDRVLFLIGRLGEAHRYLLGEALSRTLRKEESFDELVELARCDRNGRVPGRNVPTLLEACQYIDGLSWHWDSMSDD